MAQASLRRPGQRHRHPQGPAEQPVRILQPGRRLDDPPVWRHRPGPCDQQAAMRADGRDDLGGESGRNGLHLQLHHPGRAGSRPRSHRSARPAAPASWPASAHRGRQRHQPPHPGEAGGNVGHAGARHRLPAQALEWIRRGDPFDLAILDMQIPEMDGVGLAEEIGRYRDARPAPPPADVAWIPGGGPGRWSSPPR